MTTSAMRLELASRLVPGVEVWDAVEVELAVPFLLVRADEDTSSSEAVITRTFLAKAHHLTGLVGASHIRMSSVDLFSPPRLNGTTGWKLDPLTEVWECQEASDQGSAWLFVLEDGRQLADSLQQSLATQLILSRCLYKQGKAAAASGAVS